MVSSLYVCEFPQDIDEKEFEALFWKFDGFDALWFARDKNRQKIAFIDYTDEQSAQRALNEMSGFRFPGDKINTKGLVIWISDNSKKKSSGGGGDWPRDDWRRKDDWDHWERWGWDDYYDPWNWEYSPPWWVEN